MFAHAHFFPPRCAVLVAQSCPTLCDPMDCSPSGSSVHGDSLGKNTGVGCQALLQGIFPTQGSNSATLMSSALAGEFTTEPPGKPMLHSMVSQRVGHNLVIGKKKGNERLIL